MSSFKYIAHFNFDLFYCVTMDDAKRAALRNDFILSEFKRLFPLIDFADNKAVLRFITVDKLGKKLYKGINDEFHAMTQLESAYTLGGLTTEQRELVISEIKAAKDASALCGAEIKAISDKARRDIEAAAKKRDLVLSKVSAYTTISMVTIENLPSDLKVEYLKISDKIEARKEAYKIVSAYKRKLVDMVNSNNGKFPEGFDPLS